MSKMLLEEVKAAEADKAERKKQIKEEDDEKMKGSPMKDKGENRDWKRNGVYVIS